MRDLAIEFGGIDIYLFDQLQKGRIDPADKVLDAGCGTGRNACYLLSQGVDVYGVDTHAAAVATMREMATEFQRPADDKHFRVEPLEALTFESKMFDVVICSAVLTLPVTMRISKRWSANCGESCAPAACSSPASRHLSESSLKFTKSPVAGSGYPTEPNATSLTNNN